MVDSNSEKPADSATHAAALTENAIDKSPTETANVAETTENSKEELQVDATDTENPAEDVVEESPADTAAVEKTPDISEIEVSSDNATTSAPTDNGKGESLSAIAKFSPDPTHPRASIASSRASKQSNNADADMLESILHHVGDMGLYQRLLFVAMMPFGFFFAYIYFVQMFIDVAPEHYWCKIPELQHLDLEVRRMLSAPGAAAGDSWDSCRTFDVDWNDVLSTMQPPPEGTPLISCQHGWDFEFTDIPYETVATQRGWVCENASYPPTGQTIFFIGSFFGSLFFGWVGDIFGRIPAIVGSNLIAAVGGIATIYTTGVWDFFLARFITGMSLDTAFMTMYILVLEYVGFRHRTWVANMSFALYFGAGCMSLPWLALWMNDWRKLLWLTSLPIFIVVLVPFVVPESARWLVSRGRIDEAVKVLKRFERMNGTKIPQDAMDKFIEATKETEKSRQSILHVFKNPLIRFSLVFLMLLYMACCTIFDGLMRMTNTFGLDYFITFTVTSATEIPSITILTLVLDRWGRRNLAAGSMGLSALLIIIAIFMAEGIPQAAFAIAARFFINMSYNTAIQWITELLPTPVRASGSALMHTMGYIAIFVTPFVVYSQSVWSNLPLLILGVVAVMGTFVGILLPETKGLPIPQTMADSEWIVRNKSLCRKPQDAGDVEQVNVKEDSKLR